MKIRGNAKPTGREECSLFANFAWRLSLTVDCEKRPQPESYWDFLGGSKQLKDKLFGCQSD